MLKELLEEKRSLYLDMCRIEADIWSFLKKNRTKVSKGVYKVLKGRLREKKTLDEVSRELGISRERVRQMEALGLEMIER